MNRIQVLRQVINLPFGHRRLFEDLCASCQKSFRDYFMTVILRVIVRSFATRR